MEVVDQYEFFLESQKTDHIMEQTLPQTLDVLTAVTVVRLWLIGVKLSPFNEYKSLNKIRNSFKTGIFTKCDETGNV